MFYLRDLKEKKESGLLHKMFRRYSRGSFPKEPVVIRKTSKNATIKGGPNLLESLIEFVIEFDDSENYEISGKIIGKLAKEKLEAMGINIKKSTAKGDKVDIADNVSKKIVKDIYDSFYDDFALISIKSEKMQLKSKTSLGKPGSLSENFCSLKVPKEFMEEFDKVFTSFFVKDVDLKSISAKPTYVVEDILIDESIKDPAKMAKEAKRAGKIEINITKKINKDESEESFSFEFCA